jgi:hypothetical protein
MTVKLPIILAEERPVVPLAGQQEAVQVLAVVFLGL